MPALAERFAHFHNAVRQAVIQKLGVPDEDDAISEETIKKDIQQLGPLFRLVRQGIIPRSGKPIRQTGISDKTGQEMEAGAKAVAKAAGNPAGAGSGKKKAK